LAAGSLEVLMIVSSKLKAVLIATLLTGAGLVVPMPAQASDFDDDFGPLYHRPRVERQVTVTTVTRRYGYDRPVYGRPVFDDDHEPGYGRRYIERRHVAQPVFYGGLVYGRPMFDDDCRVIIKKRVNPWRDVVFKRIKRCG
jgi:hypothetical protein